MAKISGELEYPYAPLLSEETALKKGGKLQKIKVVDAQDEFKKITKATPRDKAAEEAFIASKIHMISTHPALPPEERKGLVEGLLASQSAELRSAVVSAAKKGPVPGGVGYGMFYNSPFKNAFIGGTTIYSEVICPNPPGGNVNTWLYLTATNRSAKGVEAFISYNGQDQTFFKVYDWARTDQWQTNIPFSSLTDYLWQDPSHGSSFQVIYLMNVTQLGDPNSWWNQVLLWNRASKNWDMVYQYNYSATLAEQQTGWPGSWGPIVETFQNSYTGTNPMGFLNTQLISRNGGWGSWRQLSANDSYVRTDNKGFTLSFLDPNYNWAVRS
jgi:hypothetical protein